MSDSIALNQYFPSHPQLGENKPTTDAGQIPRPARYNLQAHATSPVKSQDAISGHETPILGLYSDLQELFESVKSSAGIHQLDRFQDEESFKVLDDGVRKLIGDYINSGDQSWRKFAKEFNHHHYIRHLIDKNDDFELLILCWKPGQASRVHNHQNSHGWVTVLDGITEEIRYQPADVFDDSDDEDGANPLAASPPRKTIKNFVGAYRPCPDLIETETIRAGRGDGSLYINDGIGLHIVSCPEDCPPPGLCTLHLYSPPITKVTLYDREENKIITRIPGYYSIRGKRV